MGRIESRMSPEGREATSQKYLHALLTVEQICRLHNLDHRFVGGTLTDFLSPQTRWEIDFPNQTLYLKNYTSPQMYHSDGTIKDVDLICFCPYEREFIQGKSALKSLEKDRKQRREPFPYPSLEPTLFPDWPKRNIFAQMVSGLEVDEGGRLYLVFDKIRQPVEWETVEPWRVVLTNHGNISITTLNPFAHALRYAMRVPSGVKRKDKEIQVTEDERFNKMSLLMHLGRQVEQEAQKFGYDYRHGLYRPWIDFIQEIMRSEDLRIMVKRKITGKYWDTIGTAVAHGRGIFKPLAAWARQVDRIRIS